MELDAEVLGWQRGWECREGREAGIEGQTPIRGIKNQIITVPYQQLFTPNYPEITGEHKSGRYQDNSLFIKGKKNPKNTGIVLLQRLQLGTEDPAQETLPPILPKTRHGH